MLNWIMENVGTIFVSLLLIGIVAGAIYVIRSDKKKGKSTCGGNCGHCAMGASCHHN